VKSFHPHNESPQKGKPANLANAMSNELLHVSCVIRGPIHPKFAARKLRLAQGRGGFSLPALL
jgi:hypothetical protein